MKNRFFYEKSFGWVCYYYIFALMLNQLHKKVSAALLTQGDIVHDILMCGLYVKASYRNTIYFGWRKNNSFHEEFQFHCQSRSAVLLPQRYF